MQMRASHTPCPAQRSSKVTWPPGSAPTAAIHWPVWGWWAWQQPGQWLNAKSRALKTLQQQFWWLFKSTGSGRVAVDLFLPHTSLLFSTVIKIASLWSISLQQTSKVWELESNCTVDCFCFPPDLKSSGAEVHFFYFLHMGLCQWPPAWCRAELSQGVTLCKKFSVLSVPVPLMSPFLSQPDRFKVLEEEKEKPGNTVQFYTGLMLSLPL